MATIEFMKMRSKILIIVNSKAALFVIIAITLSHSACSTPVPPNNSQIIQFAGRYQTPLMVTDLPISEVTILVRIPANTPSGEPVYLSILDEVTGLPYNPRHIILQALDSENYGVTITAPVGSVLKYRYNRGIDSQIGEYNALGKPVRYRLYYVDGPALVTDIVARWSDTRFEEQTGRITGEILETLSSAPIPNIMVIAGGVSAISSADGSFRLEGLPAGKHQLAAYALDGAYRTFKQEIIVAVDSGTPVSVSMQSNQFVDVTFNLIAPDDTVPTIPIKVAGNLLQLGNTFGDLAGGVSTLTTRMPEMRELGAGTYSITLSLPAGFDLRYKYTLGDGIWNAEHSTAGGFLLRQLIIPEGVDTFIVEDQVMTWKSADTAPIWFDVSVPANTPETDEIYLQFKLLDWMEPLSMWRGGERRWGYQLASPTTFNGPIEFRICRNAQCGDIPGVAVEVSGNPHQMESSSQESETLIITIDNWQWLMGTDIPATVLSNAIQVRDPEFVAGVALTSNYRPSWDRYIGAAMQDIKNMNANWVILTPTWTFTQQDPPLMNQVPGRDILWPDLAQMTELAQSQDLHTAIMPGANFPTSSDEWWLEARRDFSWWQVWFEQYRRYILHHADLAESQGIDTLIIGGSWLQPALPGGVLTDGSLSHVPADARERWEYLIDELRQRYNGNISWALHYPEGINSPPPFLSLVDEIYLQWDPPIASRDNASIQEMEMAAGKFLDEDVLPFQLEIDKRIIIAISYPSANGGTTTCIPAAAGGCLSAEMLSPFQPAVPSVALDLEEQLMAYNAILSAVNDRAWISGFVSEGYFPVVQLTDKSISVHGKPAGRVLWYWFGEMLGVE